MVNYYNKRSLFPLLPQYFLVGISAGRKCWMGEGVVSLNVSGDEGTRQVEGTFCFYYICLKSSRKTPAEIRPIPK
jgi:hypothetical protein